MRGLIIACSFLTTVSFAFADEVKKVDFTTPIVVDGKPVINDFKCPPKPDGKRDCETPLTVGELAYYALQKPQPNQSWADGLKHNDLAHAIREAKDYPLLNEQLAMIENAIGPMGVPNGVIGAVAAVIDPKGK